MTVRAYFITNCFILSKLDNRYLLVPGIKSFDKSTNNVQFVVVKAEGAVTETSEDTVGWINSSPAHLFTIEKPHISHDLAFVFALKRNASDHHEVLAVESYNRV